MGDGSKHGFTALAPVFGLLVPSRALQAFELYAKAATGYCVNLVNPGSSDLRGPQTRCPHACDNPVVKPPCEFGQFAKRYFATHDYGNSTGDLNQLL